MHLNNAARANIQMRLYIAIRKYGESAFTLKILEQEVKDINIDERERYWIKQYDSYKKGYNDTIGGEGQSKFDTEEMKLLWDKGLSFSNIAKIIGSSVNTISRHLKEQYRLDEKEILRRGYNMMTNSSDEEIYQCWLQNDSINAVIKQCKTDSRRVKRVLT